RSSPRSRSTGAPARSARCTSTAPRSPVPVYLPDVRPFHVKSRRRGARRATGQRAPFKPTATSRSYTGGERAWFGSARQRLERLGELLELVLAVPGDLDPAGGDTNLEARETAEPCLDA